MSIDLVQACILSQPLVCGDYMLVGRCWTLCNLFPIRNLAVSQHAPSIVQFFIFLQSFPTFCYFVYHLLLCPGTGRLFRNRRCDFQQSNVAMLVFCFFLHSFKFACLLEINIRSLLAHFAVLPLRSRRAQLRTNANSNRFKRCTPKKFDYRDYCITMKLSRDYIGNLIQHRKTQSLYEKTPEPPLRAYATGYGKLHS